MELITAYLAGVVALIGLWALRVPHENIRTVYALSLVWPLSIAVVLFIFALSLVGADMDVKGSDRMFGFRKSPNPAIKGFAVTVFYGEVQFWKKRKA